MRRAEIVTGSAWNLPHALADLGVCTADVVVSSLPRSVFAGQFLARDVRVMNLMAS